MRKLRVVTINMTASEFQNAITQGSVVIVASLFRRMGLLIQTLLNRLLFRAGFDLKMKTSLTASFTETVSVFERESSFEEV